MTTKFCQETSTTNERKESCAMLTHLNGFPIP